MRQLILLFLCVFSLGLPKAEAQDRKFYHKEDSLKVEKYIAFLSDKSSEPAGEQIISTAKLFLDLPYVASTLEKTPETLVVNLRELDCSTLVETVLALVRTSQTGGKNFADYCNTLENIRYRNGKVSYTERLHYIADWKTYNEKKGILKDITSGIKGNIKYHLDLSFISSHPNLYKQLESNPEWTAIIRDYEKEANQRDYYYIPKESLDKASCSIKNGDIIGFVTSIKGLDVSHMAFAYWQDGMLKFIHASSAEKRVVINRESLKEYLNKQSKIKGIWIIRVNDINH